MKNSFFLVCLVLCFMASGVGQAQNQYYFNEGDTIYGRDTTYFYQWWSEQWLASDPMHKLFLEPDQTEALWAHGKIVQYFYTEHPINVVGIATSFFNYNMRLPPTPCDTLPERQEYVLLYEADTSRLQFYEVGRAPIDYTKPARYMNVDLRYNVGSPQGYSDNDYCCNVAPDKNYVIKIREYYFDKPITVKDSFYVGHTTYSNYWPDPEHGDWIYNISAWSLSYYPMNRHNECPSDELNCDTLPYQKYKFKQTDFQLPNGIFDTNEWYCFQFPAWKIEFPIIEIDSSFYDGPPQYVCPQVQNFRISYAEEGQAVMLWDTHGDHQSWQISYGPAGTEPDGGTIINCPIQVGQIMGLDTCTDYVAYIRAVCNHDSIVFSEWSEPLTINICDTTGGSGETESIEGGMGQYIQLFPSPATDQVQVMSSFELRGVEVYDLQGRTLLNIPCEGHSAGFDVENWPKGMYVALVQTSAGNFTKKLVVR